MEEMASELEAAPERRDIGETMASLDKPLIQWTRAHYGVSGDIMECETKWSG